MSGRDQAHPWYPVTVVFVLVVLLVQEQPQCYLVDASRVLQQCLEPVAHLAVERVLGEVLAPDLPVDGCQLELLRDGQSVLTQQCVVRGLHPMLLTLIRSVLEGAEVRQCFPGLVVVVDDQDVVVRLAAFAVQVGDYQGISMRVHPLGEQVPEVVHPLDVQRVGRVELLAAERLSVVQYFDLAPVHLGQRSSASREGSRPAEDIAGDGGATIVVDTPDVGLGRGRRSGRAVVGGAHDATRSANSSRTSRSSRTSSGVSDPRTTGRPERARASRSLTLAAKGRICAARVRASAEA